MTSCSTTELSENEYELLDSLISNHPKQERNVIDSLLNSYSEENPKILKLKFDYLFVRYKYRAGLEIIDKVIEESPNNGELYFYKAIMLEEFNRDIECQKSFKLAYDRMNSFDPTSPFYFMVIAAVKGTNKALEKLEESRTELMPYSYYFTKNEIEFYDSHGFRNTLQPSEGILSEPYIPTWNYGYKFDSLAKLGVNVAKNSTSASDGVTKYYSSFKYQERIDELIDQGILKSL